MEIRDVFILKNGVPIYHKKLAESNLKRDETLAVGFLSAISAFAMELGAGPPRVYATQTSRFSFLERENYSFIVYSDDDITEDQVTNLSKMLSESFLQAIKEDLEISRLSAFDECVASLINKFYQTNTAPSEVRKEAIQYLKEIRRIIPKVHVKHERIALTEQRRNLFKLIDGKNSVYEIALRLNEKPHKILNVLRSYKKEGRISF